MVFNFFGRGLTCAVFITYYPPTIRIVLHFINSSDQLIFL